MYLFVDLAARVREQQRDCERILELGFDSWNEFIAYLKQKEKILISIRVIARMQISRRQITREFSWNMVTSENCEQLAD